MTDLAIFFCAAAGPTLGAKFGNLIKDHSIVFVPTGFGLYFDVVNDFKSGRNALWVRVLVDWIQKGATVKLLVTSMAERTKESNDALIAACKKEIKRRNFTSTNKIEIIFIDPNRADAMTKQKILALNTYHPSILVNDQSGDDGAIWLERDHQPNSAFAYNISFWKGADLNKNPESSLREYLKLYRGLVDRNNGLVSDSIAC